MGGVIIPDVSGEVDVELSKEKGKGKRKGWGISCWGGIDTATFDIQVRIGKGGGMEE